MGHHIVPIWGLLYIPMCRGPSNLCQISSRAPPALAPSDHPHPSWCNLKITDFRRVFLAVGDGKTDGNMMGTCGENEGERMRKRCTWM